MRKEMNLLRKEMARRGRRPRWLRSVPGTNTIMVFGWPSMQGQGIEAAGAVAQEWHELTLFAKKNGFGIIRPGE